MIKGILFCMVTGTTLCVLVGAITLKVIKLILNMKEERKNDGR